MARMLRYVEIFPTDINAHRWLNYPHVFQLCHNRVQMIEISEYHKEVNAWCEIHFEPMRKQSKFDLDIYGARRWYTNGMCLGIRDDNDAFEFKMRWC